MNANYISVRNPLFPALLSSTDPTTQDFFVRGELVTVPSIAIVGTRTPSSYL